MRCVVHQASSAAVSTAGAAKACIAPLLRMVRRQRVQTFRRMGRPSTITRRGCTLGAQVRLLLRLEWLTLWPVIKPFSHTSQNLPSVITSPGNSSCGVRRDWRTSPVHDSLNIIAYLVVKCKHFFKISTISWPSLGARRRKQEEKRIIPPHFAHDDTERGRALCMD